MRTIMKGRPTRIVIMILFILLFFVCVDTANASTLKLPSSLTIIEEQAFYGDTSLDVVNLPEHIERIESLAFANSSLKEINLPDSLKYIADDAFSGVTDISVTANEGSYAYRWADSNGLIYHPVTGISLDKSEYTAYIDITYKIDATIYPENATNKQIKWSSSNPSIITVDENSGQIRHKQTGTATITATTVDGGFTASCVITGVQPPTGITLNISAITLVMGYSEKLIKTVLPENVYRPDSVTWSSSAPAVATVDSTGKVTAISTGEAVITVKTNDRGYTASCTVTVKPAIKVTGGTKRNGIVCRNIYITSDSAWTAETSDSWLTMYTTTDYSKRAKTMRGSAGTDVASYVWLEELPLTVASRTGKITFRNADSSYDLDIVQDRTDAPMTGVSFKPNSGTIAVGQSPLTLIPTFEPSYATDRRVTWSSDNTAVATVDASGNVKGIAPGTANITVKTTDGGFTATYTVNVNLKVTGGTKANGIYCRTIRVTATSAWTAKTDDSWITLNTVVDTSTVSKSISGNAGTDVQCYAWLTPLPTNMESRTGHIIFTCGNSTYTLNIVEAITDAPMTGVSFSPDRGTIAVGQPPITLIPNYEPSYATNRRVTWTSSNTGVASVDANGNVKGIAPGTAKITVKTSDGGFTAVYTVTAVIPVTGVTLNKTKTTINKGNSETLIATVIPSNATNKKVEWTSSLLNTAEVDANGKVTAKNAGGCTITVTTDDGAYSARCVVTVEEPISFSPAFSNLNGSNYAITYLVNEYSHYAYSANTFTGTQVEVMPSTELKLYAVGTNSNGETYAKIVYKGQTLYIPMWKVTGNWTGGAWTALSSVSSTYMYPGGARAGSIDVGDTVYTLQESNGWRQVMYNLSGSNNWKIAWYQFSGSGSVIGNSARDTFLRIAYEQVGVYGNNDNNKFSQYTGTVGYAWCAPMVSWCAKEANVSCISHKYTYAIPWELCTKGTIYILNDSKIKNDSYYTTQNNYYYNSRNNWDFLGRTSSFILQPGDLIFLDNSGSANIDHVEIVYTATQFINPTGTPTGYVELQNSYDGFIVAVARPSY